MSQTLLLNKLITYLTLTEKARSQSLTREQERLTNEMKKNPRSVEIENRLKKISTMKQESSAYLASLKKSLSGGRCYGFAICHAAMDTVGKLDWWETALGEIARWNEDAAGLMKPFLFKNLKKVVLFQDICERVLNYVLYNHGASRGVNDFLPSDINQLNFLKPDAHLVPAYKNQPEKKRSYFEMLDTYGTIQYTTNNSEVAGHFSQEQLVFLLKNTNFKNKICLIHNDGHTIRIGYRKAYGWILYDPNYNHCQKQIHKRFAYGDENALTTEIFRVMGTQSICLESAILPPKKNIHFPYITYNKWLEDSPNLLLEDKGLYILTKHTPSVLPSLLKQAQSNKELRKIIRLELPKKDISSRTTLSVIALRAPVALKQLFELSKKDKKFIAAIAYSLEQINIDHCSGLNTVAETGPSALATLWDLALDEPELLTSITKGLLIKNSRQWTVLHTIAVHAPTILWKIILHAWVNPGILAAIVTGLTQVTSTSTNAFSLLQLISYYAPSVLLLCELAKKNPSMQEALRTALTMKTISGLTGLHSIAKFAPSSLKPLLEFAETDPAILKAFYTILPQKNLDQWTLLHLIAKFAPNDLGALFTLAIKNNSLKRAIGISLLEKNLAQKTALDFIAEFSPETLPQLLHLCKTLDADVGLNINIILQKYQATQSSLRLFKPQHKRKRDFQDREIVQCYKKPRVCL